MMEPTIPHNPQMELAVLGALINEPLRMAEVANLLSPDFFYDSLNTQIYTILRQMDDQQQPIDLYTVTQKCNAIPNLKAAKVASRIVECTQSVGTGAHVVEHAKTLMQHAVARRYMAIAQQLIAKTAEGEDVADITEWLLKETDNITAIAAGGQGPRHIADALSAALKTAEKRCVLSRAGKIPGITTGLDALDRMTGGWQPSQLVILAARPAMGKTALMLTFAKAAARSGVPICIYSLEMSDISLVNRLILSECDVDAGRFRAGRLAADDWHKLERTGETLRELPIYVDDKSNVSMRYIKSHAQKMKKRGQCGIIFIDYLQLCDVATDKRNQNREREIAEASRQAKIIAKDLDVPVVLLSQLSRAVESRADKTPMLSDLRESGAIEQDADIVAFIHRPAYYGIKEVETQHSGTISTEGLGILSIAKQRDGATGSIAFRHNPSMTKITNYTPGGQPQHETDPF